MIGINDLQIGLPPSNAEQNIVAITKELSARGIRPLIVSMLYMRDAQLNQGVAQINKTVSAWAVAQNIACLDLNEVMAPQHILLNHLTWEGDPATKEVRRRD